MSGRPLIAAAEVSAVTEPDDRIPGGLVGNVTTRQFESRLLKDRKRPQV